MDHFIHIKDTIYFIFTLVAQGLAQLSSFTRA